MEEHHASMPRGPPQVAIGVAHDMANCHVFLKNKNKLRGAPPCSFRGSSVRSNLILLFWGLPVAFSSHLITKNGYILGIVSKDLSWTFETVLSRSSRLSHLLAVQP